MFLNHPLYRRDLKETVTTVKSKLDVIRAYEFFSHLKNNEGGGGWEWFWKRVEVFVFSDRSVLENNNLSVNLPIPTVEFDGIFDLVQTKVMTLDGEEETLGQRTSDEELCTYISAIMTWLILPSKGVSSFIPNLVSYDDFVRESEFDGTQVCYQKWFHAQSCVRQLVDKMRADNLFSFYNLLQRNDVQANFKQFLRAHFTPTAHTRDELDGKTSCLVLNNAQLQKSTFDSWTSENTENTCQTLNSWAKQNSRKMLVGKCDWKFVRHFDN
jgi:hypothetical protein